MLRYGTNTTPGTTDMTVAIQNALLCNHRVFVPNGINQITSSLDFDDDTEIVFESRQASIRGALTGPLLRGRNGTTQRRFHITLWSGKLDNTSRANAGGIGIDLLSVTMFKAFGTFITNVETGARIGGASSQGAFYNEFHAVDISTVDQGYELGTLGNENKTYGGRVNDSEIGVRLNNNTGNVFNDLAVETFTTYGFDVAPTTVTQYTRIINPRLENLPTSGTGIRVNAASQSTFITEPQAVGLTTNISDSGTDTIALATDKASPKLRSRRIILSQNALDSTAWGQLYGLSSGVIAARNGVDSAYATLDMLGSVVRGQVELSGIISPVQIVANTNDYNPTGIGTSSVLRLSTDASRNITGLVGFAGQKLLIFNVGSFDIVLTNEDAASSAGNRFSFGASITLNANEGIVLWYDTTSARWRSAGKHV